MCLQILICMQGGGAGESVGTCWGVYLLMYYVLLLPDNIYVKQWGLFEHFHAYIEYALVVFTSPFLLSHACFSCIHNILF